MMSGSAERLNTTLKQISPVVFSLLSKRGKEAFFPHAGILGQTAEAKGKKFNATIGIALEEDGSPMRLACLTENIPLPPEEAFPYASSFGKKELRECWQAMIREKNPSLQTRISLPIVTAALTHGLSVAGYLFLDEDDTVLVTDKFWGNYKLTFTQQFGAGLALFPTFAGNGLDIASMRKLLLQGPPGKKVLLLNFPNNPAGYTPTVQEAKDILDALRESAEAGNRIVALIDDAYFGLVYEEGILKESLFAGIADLHENILAVKIDGPTKEDYVWGMRVGFLTYATKGMQKETAEILEEKTAGAVRATISNAPHISQSLLLRAYESKDYKAQKEEKYLLLQRRYHEVQRCLKNPNFAAYFSPLPYNSGYFLCVKLKNNLDGETVRKLLLEEFDTGLIAIGNLLRIAYSSLPTAHIAPLFQNLFHACVTLSKKPALSLSPSSV